MNQNLPAASTGFAFPDWWPAKGATPTPATLPRITVVTPSYNQAPFLEATLRSVLDQGYPNLEFIVVDGGSQDGSVDIIRRYEKHLTWWVSEKDRGQVDAILKGLARATGEWFNWINSDDLLAPQALWRVAAAAGDTDIVTGPVANFSARGLRGLTDNKRFSLQPLIFQHLGGGTKYHQPGIWLRREALLQSGGLHRERHYKFDYEMLLRYVHRHPRVCYLPEVMAYFRLHEQSKTVTQSQSRLSAFQQEHADILRDLAADPAFAAQRPALELAARQCNWIVTLAQQLGETAPSRLQQLGWLWREVRKDPAARCIRHSRKAVLRLLRGSLWPQAWTSQARRRV